MTEIKIDRVIDQPQGPRGIQVKTDASHPTTRIIARIYRLVVGFEVNYIGTAFRKMKIGRSIQAPSGKAFVHDVATDTGHAFFYVTKNHKVMCFFSFGPNTDADVFNAPVATADYGISEISQLFRLKISEHTALGIVKAVEQMKAQAAAGKLHYVFATNDTCAETAEDILDDYISNLPDASGFVSAGANADTKYMYVHPFKVVNPYIWHHNFIQAGFTPITYPVKELEDKAKAAGKPYLSLNGIYVESIEKGINSQGWILEINKPDPLVEKGYVKSPY